jgi:branched-chain amino acid transport system substrate-binding protein
VIQSSFVLRVASALVALALVGCAAPASPSPTAAPATDAPSTDAPSTDAPSTDAPSTDEPSGEAIVVGSSLSLTGIFGATGIIHDIAGKQFVEQLNDQGGLLERPVEWMILDDESAADNVAGLYERLITQEEVDLLMGPYATPLILAALSVAERQGMVLPHHTSVHRPFMNYECQFPGWSIGPTPNEFVPNQLYDMLESLPNPPQSIAFMTNETGSTGYVVHGRPDVDEPAAISIAEDRGLDVVADINYTPSAEHTWDATAAELQAADPDIIFMSTLGVDSLNLLNAMEQIGYRPPLAFSLFPAPGPLLGAGELAEGHLSVSMFEPNEPILERMGPDVRAIVDEFETRAAAAGLPYTAFETQATGSWTAWEILAEGVRGAGGLDHREICDYLLENGADTTFHGHLTFNPEDGNYWPTTQGIKQIQGGDWVMVWPEDKAAAAPVGPSD